MLLEHEGAKLGNNAESAGERHNSTRVVLRSCNDSRFGTGDKINAYVVSSALHTFVSLKRSPTQSCVDPNEKWS